MTSWVEDFLAQSPLAAYPIASRLPHGIVFHLGGGERRAILQVQPVHYYDAGDWKPIVTSLVDDGGGKLHAPGLAPRVLPTGEVMYSTAYRHQTKGIGLYSAGNYQQSAVFPEGVVDTNRLVRDVGPVQHETRILETGNVQEMVKIVDKPAVLGGDYFAIATEIFVPTALPVVAGAHMLADSTWLLGGIAWDADGNSVDVELFVEELAGPRYMVYSAIPTSWLDAAVYPVTIDPTYSSQPNAANGKDAALNSNSPTANYGATASIYCGLQSTTIFRRILVEFDLSSIPSGATISSAVLDVYDEQELSQGGTTIYIYRLRRGWVESEVTWNQASSGVSWGTAGAKNATTDFDNTALASRAFSGLEAPGHKTWGLNASKIEEMVGFGPSFANNGFMLVGNEGLAYEAYYKFASSDHATVSWRPKLDITYTAPPGRTFHIPPLPY